MDKEKFIEEQCIPLSRPKLYDEIFNREQDKENLIKYIEDKIKEIKDECASYGHLIDKDIWYEFDLKISGYQDILERIKNNDWN